MAHPHDKSVLTDSSVKEVDGDALLRRAARAAKTSEILIGETEQLLAQSRELIRKSGLRLISPKQPGLPG